MEWYKFTAYFIIQGIQILLCLSLVTALLHYPKKEKLMLLISLGAAAFSMIFYYFPISQPYLIGIEVVLQFVIIQYLFHGAARIHLFLIIVFRITVALWDFLISTWTGVLFHSNLFIDNRTAEYLSAILTLRFLMIGIAAIVYKKYKAASHGAYRGICAIAAFGMFGVVALTEQTSIELNDDLLNTWSILSLIPLIAVMVYNLNSQYNKEKEIANLKVEQVELLQRDYQLLNNTYSSNARLFHDLHNHMDILHHFLEEGKTEEALHYLECFYTPISEIAQTMWTGDEAVDYLINSKLAIAQLKKIQTRVNIEFPRHTNIRSTDLTAILGNLLDNALEAIAQTQGNTHFLYITIRRINDMLIIKVENDYAQEPTNRNGELLTSKNDQTLHGWGLKNCRTAAEQYNGTLETSYRDNTFRAVVTLSYQYSKIEACDSAC